MHIIPFGRITVAQQMQARRRDALRDAPGGGVWETAAVAALRDVLHLVDYAHIPAHDLAIVREARLLVDNHREAVQRYEREQGR